MRDPRIDPQPGDVVRVLLRVHDSLYETRTVEGPLLPNGLQWQSETHHGVCMFRTWRRWAKRGEVVRVSEGEQK
jgi:hypothetical protein